MAIFSNDFQNCIFSQNGGKFITLSQISWHYIPTLSYHAQVSYAAVFVSIFTQRKDIKKKCVGDYFLLTTPPPLRRMLEVLYSGGLQSSAD